MSGMGKQRRRRRQPDRIHLSHPSGLEFVAPSLEEVIAASAPFLADPTWKQARRLVVPVFERLRPFPSIVPASATMILPPGVTVGFGVDVGPAFMRISELVLERWSVGLDELARVALRNLRDRARRAAPYRVVEDAVDGVPIAAFQSNEGWASTLVLVADALEAVFGPDPRLFVAPCRDLLIGLPADVDLGLATTLSEAFEAADPNGLCLEGFLLADGRVTCTPLAREPIVA
jgi:hypothetical protein